MSDKKRSNDKNDLGAAVQQLIGVGGSALTSALMAAATNSAAEEIKSTNRRSGGSSLSTLEQLLSNLATPLPKHLASEVKIPVLLERTKNFLKILSAYYRMLCADAGASNDNSMAHFESFIKIFENEGDALLLSMADPPFEGERRKDADNNADAHIEVAKDDEESTGK